MADCFTHWWEGRGCCYRDDELASDDPNVKLHAASRVVFPRAAKEALDAGADPDFLMRNTTLVPVTPLWMLFQMVTAKTEKRAHAFAAALVEAGSNPFVRVDCGQGSHGPRWKNVYEYLADPLTKFGAFFSVQSRVLQTVQELVEQRPNYAEMLEESRAGQAAPAAQESTRA